MPDTGKRNGGFGHSARKHHDVFISYAQMDKPIADAICAKLESRKIRCWIAPRDVAPSREFPAAIIEGIEGAQFLVLVFSSHANNSPHVIRELTNAVNKGRIIIPFRIEDVQPSKSMEYLISVPHWLDAITPPLEKHIDELADTIGHLLSTSKEVIICPLCRTPLSSRAKFCTACGHQIPEEEEAEREERPAQPVEPVPPPQEPAPVKEAGSPFQPWKNKKVIAGILAVAVVLIVIGILIPVFSPALVNPIAALNIGPAENPEPAQTETIPVDYRGEGALVNVVQLTTEPTQPLPEKTALYVEAAKDSTNAEVTVQFTGGGGLGLVQDNRVVLTRSDGTVTTEKLDFNTRLSEVTLQGTRGTDRLQVIVTMKSGTTYTIIDRLMPYRVRGST